MAKLVLSLNGAIQSEFELDQEKITIGRKPGSDITIDNLAVSGKHSMIITILDDSFLEDLGSTNGTYVNGKLVKKHALKDGDIMLIGKHELKYINENASDDDDYEKTVIVRPSTADAAIAAAEKAGVATAPYGQTPQAENKMPAGRLTVLSGPIAGKELELIKALVTLGKPGAQVAVISRRPQGYFLVHVESKGGFPVVNGEEIGTKTHQLKDGDLIELAGIKMEFTAG